MFNHTGRLIDTGEAMTDLWDELACWSDQTFGPPEDRGPLGCLRHLMLEAKEAEEEQERLISSAVVGDLEETKAHHGKVMEEIADCLMLVLDAARRSNVDCLELLKITQLKLDVNKQREWPSVTPDTPEIPVEHKRDENDNH